MKVLSIGRLIYDINILMDTYPIEGSQNVTKELVNCSGGATNVTAYALAKWNFESFVSGVIGYDEIGNTMKKSMEENQVKTNYLETNYDIKTPVSYILFNKQSKMRTMIQTEISEFNIKKYEYDVAMDLVISDGSEYNASIHAFNKYRDSVTLLNAKDTTKNVYDFFKYAKYVVCDSKVAEAVTGLKMDFENPVSMVNVYKKIIDKFPHVQLILSMEDKGSIYSVNNEIKILSAMNSEVVDKTGSSDLFVAMIGYGIVNHYSLETTIRLATIAEDLSKKAIGETLSIPPLSDVIGFYESKFGKLQNPNEAFIGETQSSDQNVVPQ